MLRDDKDVALNAVLVACRKTADHYGQAAELSASPEWAERFERLARLRHADAERVEWLVRRFGYLPEEPDRDRQDISQLATLTRTTVSDDNEALLREKARELEGDVEGRTREALALEWPPQALDLLAELEQTSRDVRDEMTTKD